MEDNKNRNYSRTFGQFSDSGVFSENGNNIKGPKNITSDMWTPISTGNNSKTSQPAKNERKTGGAPENAATSVAPASEGRQTQKKAKSQQKNQTKKKEKSGAEKQKKSRVPKGNPVSQKKTDENKNKNKKPSASELKQKQKKAKSREEIRRLENEKRARESYEVNRNNRDYEIQSKQGRSHNEISRRRAADKRKKRLIRNIAAALVFFCFIGAFIGVYAYSKGAPAQNIIFEGESVYTNEQISAAAGIVQGINMLSLKEKNINEAVTAALPYIHSVEIRRKLPDTLTITVTPTTEKYLIVNGTGQICVDEYEKILSLKKHKLQEGKFRIYGFEQQDVKEGSFYEPSESNKEKYELVKNIISCIEKEGVIAMGTVNVTNVEDVRILYNKVMIYLGDCKDLEKQISLASDVIKQAVTSDQTGYIDLRYSDMAFFNEGTMTPG